MVSEDALINYLKMFEKMKRSNINGYVAPHKPVLLLAIQYRIQTGWITDNLIYPDKALVDQFSQFWNNYVDNGRFQELKVCDSLFVESNISYPYKCKMNYPFYHLNSEPFWHLVQTEEWVKRYDYSMIQLRKCFRYAELDLNLFEMMKIQPFSDRIRSFLEGMI